MTSEQHVLLVAVGPVQPFIAAARKIRDLWAGSVMLSELSLAAAKSLQEQHCELIFPSPSRLPADGGGEEDYGIANKIFALTPNGSTPADIASQVAQAVAACRERWFDELELSLRGDDHAAPYVNFRRLAHQREDYGEFYAVWTPLRPGDYQGSYRRAEGLLSARKMLRPFSPPTWEVSDATGRVARKNSLDGARESVVDASARSGFVAKHTIKLNEYLDALGLLKRWRGQAREVSFETLSDLALSPYLRGIDASADPSHRPRLERARSAIAALQNSVPKADRQEADTLLYRNRLNVWLRENTANESLAARKALTEVNDLPGGELHAYASIFHGDGDRMGVALSQIDDPAVHQEVARQLGLFNAQTAEIVKAHHGSLIYSGGDDVLAFLPLDAALAAAVEIREAFATAVAAALPRFSPADRPTFSAGLAIVHHLESLHASLEIARRAEREAKEHHDRDALAIIQCIRGAGERTIGGKWGTFDQATNTRSGAVGRWLRLVELFLNDEISSRLAHQLLGVARVFRLEPNPSRTDPVLLRAAATEAKRLIEAKQEHADSSALLALLSECGDVRQFAHELIVAQQFAAACRLAEKGPS